MPSLTTIRVLIVAVIVVAGVSITAATPVADDEAAASASSEGAEATEDEPADKESPEETKNDGDKEDAPAEGVKLRPQRPVFIPGWGGRLQAFFRRPVILPGAEKADDEQQSSTEAPPSVVLADNGDLRRRLERIRTLLDEQHLADGARELGQLLQNPETRDFFLSRDENRRDGRSFQAELRFMIRNLPADGRAVYAAQFEPVAKQQLHTAIEAGSESALRDVALRFPATPSGDEALYRLAHRLWEHGRPEPAAACLARLLAAPDSSARFEPGLSLLLAACQRHCGQSAEFAATAQRLQTFKENREARLAGRPLADVLPSDPSSSNWDRLLGPISPRNAEPADDWTVFRGGTARNRTVAARAPLLAPRWSAELPLGTQARMAADRRARAHRDGRGTHVPMLSPLAIGDLLLTRVGRGIVAWSLESGAAVWKYPTGDALEGGDDGERLWREPGGGLFAADHECFYVVDAGDSVSSAADARNLTGRLSAHEHFQGREGRLRWQVGGSDGGNEPALAGISFLGAPLSYRGRSYVLAEWKGAITLVVLDNVTGRLAWSQELALIEESVGEDPFRRMVGAAPTISADDVIICPTSGGAVIAVDLTTQSLLWAYRYSRKPAMTNNPFDEGTPRLDQRDRWLDGTVTIAGDFVLLTPPESGDLHCLNRHDGHVAWTKPRGKGLFLGGIAADRVLVVDRAGMTAWNLSDGEPAWPAPLEFPSPSIVCGRGVLAEQAYYIPVTTGAIVQVDVTSGQIAADHRMIREQLPGNLIWHRGTFISQGPELLQAFDEVSAVERQLESTPTTAAELVIHGDLQLARGEIDAAIKTFRSANAAAPGGKARSRLIAALLDGVRLNLPEKAELEAELDRLLLP